MTPGDNDSTGADGTALSAPAVELAGVTKRYGSVVACDDVDLSLFHGRIHGILGENGAGKSTLMKVLIGLVVPDAGTITIGGEQHHHLDPMMAAANRIAMVHQHFSLVEPLTVWENVALGESGPLDPNAVRVRIGEIIDQYGLAIDPDARVGDLTAGLRQRVEIIKCLRRDPSVVLFDEPTSVLTPDESAQLFDQLRNVVAAEGRAVVLVSHKLDEVMAATDEITIMRQGRVVERLPTTKADAPSLARAMVGREVSLRSESAALGMTAKPHSVAAIDVESRVVLSIRGASVKDQGGVKLLDGLDLDVRAGEIVGVAGVEGNGQRTLADMLSSLVPLRSGSVSIEGEEISTSRAGAMSRAGVAVIPEDRHDSGVVLEMSIAENLMLVDQSRVSNRGVIDLDEARHVASQMIYDFDVQCDGPNAPMWSLSGGNQQRVVLARELSNDPKVLVAAQPTRGLDVGAIEYISDRLRAAAAEGVAVLLISSELEEILDLAHRIVVMHENRIVGEMPRAGADLERIGLLMTGAGV